jgi:hypothetical protein
MYSIYHHDCLIKDMNPLYLGMDQYLLIPFNTFFRGMNIHFNPAILMWTTGVQGLDTLPYKKYIVTDIILIYI